MRVVGLALQHGPGQFRRVTPIKHDPDRAIDDAGALDSTDEISWSGSPAREEIIVHRPSDDPEFTRVQVIGFTGECGECA